MRSLEGPALSLLAVAFVLACDPLAEVSWQGEHLASFVGGVMELEPGLIHRDDLRASIFWSPGEIEEVDWENLVEQVSTAQPVGIPSDYELLLYEPPADEVLIRSDEGSFAIGVILVYPDEDGDGRRGADESFLGAANNMAMVYATEELPGSISPTGLVLPAGFHRVVLPLPCVEAPEIQGESMDCGVELGAPCASDEDCGEGVCLTEENRLTFPWPEGACAYLETGPDSCHPVPAGLVLMRNDTGGARYWVRWCARDKDCEDPRREEPYRCDIGSNACVPENPLQIVLGVNLPPMSFCQAPPDSEPPF